MFRKISSFRINSLTSPHRLVSCCCIAHLSQPEIIKKVKLTLDTLIRSQRHVNTYFMRKVCLLFDNRPLLVVSSSLCDYPLVNDFRPEINFEKLQTGILACLFLFLLLFHWSCLMKIDSGKTNTWTKISFFVAGNCTSYWPSDKRPKNMLTDCINTQGSGC